MCPASSIDARCARTRAKTLRMQRRVAVGSCVVFEICEEHAGANPTVAIREASVVADDFDVVPVGV